MYYESKLSGKKKMKKSLLAACFVLTVMFTMTVIAADQPTVAEGEKIPVFNCEEDFGIRKALAMLGSMCGKNIVPSPSVDGQLAFRSLRDVTFEEAMDAILGEGFVYSEEGNLIKVYTKDEYHKIMQDPARMIYRVFTLYYITAAEAEKLIEPAVSPTAKVSSSTPAEEEITGASGTGASGGSLDSAGGGDTMALNDTIVVYDFPENIAKVEEMLSVLDARPRQVLVEATILSALLNEDMELGFDWNLLSGTAVTGFPSTLGTNLGTPVETTGFAFLSDGLRIGVSSDKLQGFISALETVTDVTVLANPKILAVNKQEGSVLIGKNIGYRSSTTIGQGGVATQGEVKFLETGTMLVFRPYIANDDYIRMEIYPKDSSAELDSDGVPQETTTQLKSNILVKDGETIVVGGLFRDVVTTSREQVPLLGDIPLLGALFRGQSNLTEREEVMIMLTPHIIGEPSETGGEERAADIQRKMRGANDELMPISRKKIAEDNYNLAAKFYVQGDSVRAMKHLNAALAVRPSYLEALRLKERIISQTDPDKAATLERKVLDKVEQKEAPNWHR
jgi:type IV pilus assembly protein PilQ